MTTATKNKRPSASQATIIRRARQILQPTEVSTGTIPAWLVKRLQAANRAGRIDNPRGLHPNVQTDVTFLLPDAVGPDAQWLDHWGTAACPVCDDAFVAEPYEFYEETIESAQRFAELLDLSWLYSPNSWHYPGHTFRLLFWPKGAE